MTSTLADTGASRAGLIQISVAGVLWGTGGLTVQLIRQRTPLSVLTLSELRMALAAVALGLTVVLSGGTRELLSLIRERPRLAATVGAATGAYQALYFLAVVTVGVSASTVIGLGLAPVLLTVSEWVRRQRRPSPRSVFIVVAGVGGLVLVSVGAGASSTGPHPVVGLLAASGAAAGFAVTAALGRSLAHGAAPLAVTTATTSIGAIALVPVLLLDPTAGLAGGLGHPDVLVLLAHLGVMTMALPYALLYAGLRTVPASFAAVTALVEPATAAVVAAAILGEHLGLVGVLGVVVILAAVAALAERR